MATAMSAPSGDTGDPNPAADIHTAAAVPTAAAVSPLATPSVQVRKAAIISVNDGKIVRAPGFLRITDARVSVLDINLRQIGSEIALKSINGGASCKINGLWIKIGPETRISASACRDFHREPPSARVCDVVRLGGQLGLAQSMAACAQPVSGPQPNTV
jgi:hypothetical protein